MKKLLLNKTCPLLKSPALPVMAVIGIVLFWGTSNVSTKVVLNTGVSPVTVIFMRFLFASIVLFPIFRKLEPNTKVKSGDRLWIILNGLFGGAVYYCLESTGIKLTSASNSSMIMACFPIFTIIADYIFCRNRITWLKGLGVMLSVLGISIIIRNSYYDQGSQQSFLGNLLILGACLAEVAFILISRKLSKNLSGLAITTYQVLYGVLFTLPLALPECKTWININAAAWLNILYLAIFCQAICFFLYQYALASFGPVCVSSYSNLISMVGVLTGTLFLRERVSLQQIAGGIIIIAGVFIVNRKQ